MDFLWLLVGLVIGALAVWLYLNRQYEKRLADREAELMEATRRAEQAAEKERDAHGDTRLMISDLEDREATAQERVSALTLELKTASSELERVRREHENVQQQTSEVTAAKNAASEKLESLQSELNAVRDQLERARSGEADKSAKLDEQQTVNTELTSRLEYLETQRATFDEQLKEAVAERTAASQTAAARISELQEQLDRCNQDAERLKADLASLRTQQENRPAQVSHEPDAPSPAAAAHQAPVADMTLVPGDAADDLTKIKGIGPVLKTKLAGLGITTFRQIADFTQADIERVNAELDFPGRIEREQWIEQARAMINW